MRLTGHRCRCHACGEHFRRTSIFDRHRSGQYTQRRCLTSAEMTAKGMTQDANGVWYSGSASRTWPKQKTSQAGRYLPTDLAVAQ